MKKCKSLICQMSCLERLLDLLVVFFFIAAVAHTPILQEFNPLNI